MARSFYIDFVGGSDANSVAQAQSKATPWKHHPWMAGSSISGYTFASDDAFYLKGGVEWDSTCFPLTNSSNGTAGHVVYIGVDATWYTGGSWARPIFNNGGTSSTKFITCGNYWQVDNIEFTGYFWDSTHQTYGTHCMISLFPTSNSVISNCYFHGWSHASYASGCRDFSGNGICGSTSATNVNNIIRDCLFDGADTDGISMMAVYDCPIVRNCTIRNMSNAVLTNGVTQEVSGCTIGPISASFDSTQHSNGIESNGSGAVTSTIRIFNNLIHNVAQSVIIIDPPSGTGGVWTSYVYNNVIYSCAPTLVQQQARTMGAVNALYVWNNTFDSTGSTASVATGNSNIGTLHYYNNHQIGAGPFLTSTGSTTVSQGNNVTQTLVAANAQGYTSSQTNPYSPTATSNATYNTGTPDTDTGSVLDILGVARPTDSTWDVGAYEYNGAGGPDVTPPTPNPATIASVTANSPSQITVVASTATDAVALHATPYDFSIGGSYQGYQAGATKIFTGLTPGTSYAFKVRYKDAAGNVTPESGTNNTSTLAAILGTARLDRKVSACLCAGGF